MKICSLRGSETDAKGRPIMPEFCRNKKCNGLFFKREPQCDQFKEMELETENDLVRAIDAGRVK